MTISRESDMDVMTWKEEKEEEEEEEDTWGC